MNTTAKLVLAIVAVAAIPLATLLWLDAKPDPLALERETSAPKTTPAATPEVLAHEPLASDAHDSERATVAGEVKATLTANTSAAKPAAETTIVAHLVDESLRPVAGAWLRGGDSGRAELVKLNTNGEALAGRDGIATLRWEGPGTTYPTAFAAGAPGYATVFPTGNVKEGEVLHLGDIVLPPGGAVSGRVVDTRALAVEKAEVIVANNQDLWGPSDLERMRASGPHLYPAVLRTASDARGQFKLDGVPVGMTRVWARSGSGRWSVTPPLEIQAQVETPDVLLTLDDSEKGDPELLEIEGVVFAPDGSPVAKAQIGEQQRKEGSSWGTTKYADEKGHFRIKPRDRGVRISLDFKDPGELYTHVLLDDLKPGTKDLVVQLELPKKLTLAVTDESGPVEDYRVQWSNANDSEQGYVDPSGKHADGRALVRVPASSFFSYVVQAPGHLPEKVGPVDGRTPPLELAVKLHSVPGIHGRVLAGADPLPGARVVLHEQSDKEQIEMCGFTTLVQPQSIAEATSDKDGRFTLDLQRDGTFAILATAEGYALAHSGPFELEAAKGMQELVIRLDAGGTLEGNVLMPPGRSATGVIVSVNRGDSKPRTLVVGPDAKFRFEHLTAGAWELARASDSFSGPNSVSTSRGDNIKPGEIRHDFSIAAGQTTRRDLDLRNAGPCTLEIELTLNGKPAQAWSVVAWPSGKHTFTGAPPSATTDASGHARLESDEPGEFSLKLTPPAELASEFRVDAQVTLDRGPNHWSRDLRTGRVEGSIAHWQADVKQTLRVNTNVEPAGNSLYIHPDADGRFVLPLVLAGPLQIKRKLGSEYDSGEWETLKELELAAGESKSLQLQ